MKLFITNRFGALAVALAVAVVLSLFGIITPAEVFASAMVAPMILGETDVSLATMADLVRKQGEGIELMRKTNDEKLQKLEKDQSASVSDFDAKLAVINADLTKYGKELEEVVKKASRLPLPTGQVQLTPEEVEHKEQFHNFIRKGKEGDLKSLEKKVFRAGSDVEGGYRIPAEMDEAIERFVGVVSAIRGLADVRTIGGPSLKSRVKTSGVGGRWIGQEAPSGGESATPKYATVEITAEEVEAEPHAYNSAIEDADFDVEADLTEEAGITFGELEAIGFVTGDGIRQPRGFLDYPTVANASYAWGSVGVINSGGAADFAASNPADPLIDLLHSLKSQFRNGSVLVMNDLTLAKIRQFKDGSGAFYLFNPDPTGGFAGFVLGVPVVIDDNMPSVGANALPIAYANWTRAYRIVDRTGIALIRDNITEKGTTKFNFRKRVGGGIKNFEAIKFMKIAA